jgi:phage tail sheath gpL-like
MPINTGVPTSLNRPQTFHTFSYLRAAGSLTNVPLRIALIGAKSSAGTATAGTVYTASDAATTDALFGASSELALMCRKAYECSVLFQRGPQVYAVPIAESAGVANVKTITQVGTATTDGNIIVRVAGRTFVVGVRNGDAQNTVTASIAAALKANAQNLPVIVTSATNVVTLTHATKGINGVDVAVSVDQQVAGCVATVANTVTGTGATDHQPALDSLSPLRYDGIVFANHASADITEILADLAVRWGAASKTWGWYFVGEMGTISTATALAAAANHQAVVVTSMEGCLNTAGEMATATAMLVWSRERPNANYDKAKVPLYPPAAATIYTGAEVETAILAGLTAFTASIDSSGAITQNLAKCERLVTTKTTTGSSPDDRNRDIGTSRVGVALAIQIDIAYDQRFSADTNPDGALQDEDTDAQVKDMVAAIMRSEARDNVLRSDLVEADISQIQVEHDSVALGRDNVAIFYHPVGGLHQVAYQHNVQIGA